MYSDDEMVMCLSNDDVRIVVEHQLESDGFEKFFSRCAVPVRRGDAENDNRFRQVIPYCVFMDNAKFSEDTRIVCYFRGSFSGEKRLYGKMSLGFGGHVREGETFYAGTARELAEELNFKRDIDFYCSMLKPFYIANDDTNVNIYHFGVVQFIYVNDINIKSNENEIGRTMLLSLREISLRFDEFENWSQIVIDHLNVRSL